MTAFTDLGQQTRLVGGHVDLPRVNLLPPEIAERAQFRKIQAGLGGALALVLVAVGMLFMSASGSVDDAQAQVDSAAADRTTLQGQIAEFDNVNDVYAKAAAARTMLATAMGAEVRYSRLLDDLALSIPDNVWLTSAQYTQAEAAAAGAASVVGGPTLGTVTMSGKAFEHNDVATWLESLAKQKAYGNPYLDSSTETLLGERVVVDWSTTVVLTPQALSGRYLNETER